MDGLAVVTGAGSGIGAALARELDRRGARVALCDVNPDGLRAVAAGLSRPARAEVVDVADAAAVDRFARAVMEDGPPRWVFANAGVSLTEGFLPGDPASFAWVMDVNFWGVVHTTRAFLPAMVGAGRGRMVLVSSIFGVVGMPNQTAYCASKAAVRGFGESLCAELVGTGVGVTVVHPGAVATNIVRGGRKGVMVGGMTEGKANRLIDRGMPPDRAAGIVLDGVEAGRRRVLVGGDARLLDRLQRALPERYRDLVRWGGRRLAGRDG